MQRLIAEQRSDLEAKIRALEAKQESAASGDGLDPSAKIDVDADSFTQKLRIYGFADMGAQKVFYHDRSRFYGVAPTNASTFVLGNIDLYLDAQPFERWRTLIEFRLTNYPDGNDRSKLGTATMPYRRDSTAVYDTANASGPWNTVRWSGIVLQRAYIEWVGAEWLALKVGYFFTPFGIWNVDHGTPTLIALTLPEAIQRQLFPVQQLGVQAFGTLHQGFWDLGYYLYLTNGRTPAAVPLTEDKMVGGRLTASTRSPMPMMFGLSGFTGRTTDGDKIVKSDGSIDRTITVDYRERGFGADASLDVGDLRLRSELFFRRVEYEEGKRNNIPWDMSAYWPDRTNWSTYLLAAYQLGWGGLEPYAMFELNHFASPLGNQSMTPSAGLNLHFTPGAQLKLQYSFTHYVGYDPDDASSINDNHFVAARLVLAF